MQWTQPVSIPRSETCISLYIIPQFFLKLKIELWKPLSFLSHTRLDLRPTCQVGQAPYSLFDFRPNFTCSHYLWTLEYVFLLIYFEVLLAVIKGWQWVGSEPVFGSASYNEATIQPIYLSGWKCSRALIGEDLGTTTRMRSHPLNHGAL